MKRQEWLFRSFLLVPAEQIAEQMANLKKDGWEPYTATQWGGITFQRLMEEPNEQVPTSSCDGAR